MASKAHDVAVTAFIEACVFLGLVGLVLFFRIMNICCKECGKSNMQDNKDGMQKSFALIFVGSRIASIVTLSILFYRVNESYKVSQMNLQILDSWVPFYNVQ